MDLELNDSGAMSKTGSFACMSQDTITNIFDSLVSCVIFAAIIYIILFTGDLASVTSSPRSFVFIGAVSLITVISAPIGLIGASKGNYWLLFSYFILSSYHVYGLVMYMALTLKDSDGPVLLRSTKLNLHQVTVGSYTLVVLLSFGFACCKIISATNKIEPAKVIVVDNNPFD